MRSFFGRQFGIVRADQIGRDRKARSRRLQARVEGLESRNLMSVGGGISLTAGTITIAANLPKGNTAQVSIDPANHDVKVTLNGNSEEFAPSLVTTVYYSGAAGGGDTFVNSTSITGIEYGWGGNNTFTGGSGQDYMFLWGNGNTAHDDGGFAVAFTHGGQDNIDSGILKF